MGDRRQTHSKVIGNIGPRKCNSCSAGGLKKVGLKEDPSKSHGHMTSNLRLVLWESLLAFFQDVNEKLAQSA
jgi:hypothetical protein